MTIVVDASVAVKWVIPWPGRPSARAGSPAPEAANALWKKLTRREITAREAAQAIDLLMASGLDLRPSGPLLGRALALARRLRHPVYDGIYLALAQAEGATLITADQRLLARVARGRTRVAVVDLATL